MTGINALVTIYTTDLKHSLKSAYDQSLQVKLQGNTKFYILIQCVIMSLKWTGSSTTGVGYHCWCLYLHEISSSKEGTDLFDDLGTFDESLLNILVHDQIHISLTITHIGIGNSMIFFWKNL